MQTQPTFIDNHYLSHQPPLSQRSQEGDLEASNDDLLDGQSEPKTFSTLPSSGKKISYSLAEKPSLSGSDFTKSSDGSPNESRAYPPRPSIPEPDFPPFWEMIIPDSVACRLYIITVLIQTAVDLAIEGDLLIRVNHAIDNGQLAQDFGRKMPVYLSVFALAHVFQLAMAINAVHARNTLQFFFLIVFNAVFLAYAIIQIDEIKRSLLPSSGNNGISNIPVTALTTIIPIVISVAEAAYIGLSWKIQRDFGWKVYKSLGADRTIKRMYATYQVFECIIKFDVFFWAAFSVEFIWLVLNKNDWEYYVTYAALPFSLLLLLEGHLAARYEKKWMMATFMLGCVGAMVYFIFKLVRVITRRNEAAYHLIFKSLTAFTLISIVFLILTFAYAFMVMRNFGKGLKEALSRRDASSHSRYPSQTLHHRAASTTLNRMTIE